MITPNRRMDTVVLLVLDGLRPDMIDADRMPFVNRLRQQSVSFPSACSVFPTATRVCSGTLTTGTTPIAHGLAENSLLLREGTDWTVGVCADQQFLTHVAETEKRRLLLNRTLPERLRDAGKASFCGGSGSTGTTYLMDPTETGSVLHWSTAWPQSFKDEIEQATGFLSPETTTDEQNAFILTHAMNAIRSSEPPALVWVWLTEPDTAQHDFGLGSDEALAVMKTLDQRVEAFVEETCDVLAERKVTFLVLSDHGAVTPMTGSCTLAERFDTLPIASQLGNSAFKCYENSIAVANTAHVSDIVHALVDQTWVASILVRDDVWNPRLPALKQSDVGCGGQRSAEIMVSFASSDELNTHDISGLTSIGSNRAQHGSGSGYELNPLLLAWAPGIEPKTDSCACGLVDMVPTVCALLGVDLGSDTLHGTSLTDRLAVPGAGVDAVNLETDELIRGPFRIGYGLRNGNRYVRGIERT